MSSTSGSSSSSSSALAVGGGDADGQEADRYRVMNSVLAERMDRGIAILTKQIVENDEGHPFDMVKVKLALAAIKQVRDVLAGDIDFDGDTMHANETTLLEADVRKR